MRILIAITSCVKFALNGSNQASRDTWMKVLKQIPDVSCKFFVGDGTPSGDEDTYYQYYATNSTHNFKDSLADCPHVHLDDPRVILGEQNPYLTKEDEVTVHAPDDYIYHTWKTKEMLRWALENKFDFIFMAAGDTYIDPLRLIASKFEQHDYTGRQYGGFAVGGSGYWLSKKAAQYLVGEPAHDWATDRWIGYTLEKNGIVIHGDQRYGASPQQNPGLANPSPLFPEESNEQITAHLAEAPGHYHHDLMYKAHEIRGRKYGLNERSSNDGSARLRLATTEALCNILVPVRIQGDQADASAEHLGVGQKEPFRPRFQTRRLQRR